MGVEIAGDTHASSSQDNKETTSSAQPLPEWMARSTISGQLTAEGASEKQQIKSNSIWGIGEDDDDDDDDDNDDGNNNDNYNKNTQELSASSLPPDQDNSTSDDAENNHNIDDNKDDAEAWYRQQLEQQQEQLDQTNNKRLRNDSDNEVEENEEKRVRSSIFVKVQGKDVALDDVTEEMHDLMVRPFLYFL